MLAHFSDLCHQSEDQVHPPGQDLLIEATVGDAPSRWTWSWSPKLNRQINRRDNRQTTEYNRQITVGENAANKTLKMGFKSLKITSKNNDWI